MEDSKQTIKIYWQTQALAAWCWKTEDLSCLMCLLRGPGSYAHVHYKKWFLLYMRRPCVVPCNRVISNCTNSLWGLGSSLWLAVRTPTEDLHDILTCYVFCPVSFYRSKCTSCRLWPTVSCEGRCKFTPEITISGHDKH